MKKRQGARGGTDQSEGFWEKRHRQDISSHWNHCDGVKGGGGVVCVCVCGWGGGAGEGVQKEGGCRYQPWPPKHNKSHQLMERKLGERTREEGGGAWTQNTPPSSKKKKEREKGKKTKRTRWEKQKESLDLVTNVVLLAERIKWIFAAEPARFKGTRKTRAYPNHNNNDKKRIRVRKSSHADK